MYKFIACFFAALFAISIAACDSGSSSSSDSSRYSTEVDVDTSSLDWALHCSVSVDEQLCSKSESDAKTYAMTSLFSYDGKYQQFFTYGVVYDGENNICDNIREAFPDKNCEMACENGVFSVKCKYKAKEFGQDELKGIAEDYKKECQEFYNDEDHKLFGKEHTLK